MSKDQNKRERKVSRRELADHFSVTPETVTNWLKRRVIPCYRTGKVLRFSIPDVERALEKGVGSENLPSRKVVV